MQHVRERIVLQRLERRAKARVRSEFLQRLVGRNELHTGDVRSLARAVLELLRLGQRHIRLQIDRQLHGVGEARRSRPARW